MPTTSSSTSTSTSPSTTTPPPSLHHPLTNILHSTTTSLLSPFLQQQRQPKLTIPFQFVDASFPLPTKPTRYPFDSTPRDDSISSNSASVRNRLPSTESNSGFPSTVRIGGLNSNGVKGGGPAFVGQVFSMCDLSGTGLMAVSTHFDIPFISKRTPEWLKKMFASVIKSERNGPVFRFFMDLGDAVTYVKRLNIPSGVVGACRLDLAYEHFKEKPHLFQFVPNEKQVKAANQLLKMMAQSDGKKKVDGVPVFTAQNLDIAIATIDGIKWYTPYFFDKNMLDSILEESVDQHFHSLIQTRHMQRRRDVIDDNLAAEVIEEMGESLLEPPEVQEMLDEMGNPGIPLSVISKAAEIQLLYAVDRIILGNRWLRKATGIQPKFPYVVDSFQRRSASSLQKTSKSTDFLTNSEMEDHNHELHLQENTQIKHDQGRDLRLPFQDWFNNQWLKQSKPKKESDVRIDGSTEEHLKQLDSSRFLPKITMVGISTGDTGHMSKGSLKKTMEELTKELEQLDQGSTSNNPTDEFKTEDRDPLFVANVGDYYSGMSKTGSSRWVRSGIN